MNCPCCGSPSRVTHTVATAGEVRRRRRCTTCGRRFRTTERSDDQQQGIDAKARRALRDAQEIIEGLTVKV
ncbi:MAG: hypothetical protein IT445_06890 [Phycisphaeraceae bacterium]|nr:hypothetical protein [Phycisphaeraceae bacterium]